MEQEIFIKESVKKLFRKGLTLSEIENTLGIKFITDKVLTEEEIRTGNFNFKQILNG